MAAARQWWRRQLGGIWLWQRGSGGSGGGSGSSGVSGGIFDCAMAVAVAMPSWWRRGGGENLESAAGQRWRQFGGDGGVSMVVVAAVWLRQRRQ